MSTTSARRSLAAAIATLFVAGLTLVGAAPASATVNPPVLVVGAPDHASHYVEYNGLLYLSGLAPGDTYSTVFSYDGTSFAPLAGSPSGVNNLVVFDGKLIITAVDDIASPPFDYVLYSYDGSTITPLATPFVSPISFYEFGGILYFVADIGGVFKPWQYDGTTFTQISGAFDGAQSFTSLGSLLYVVADDNLTAAFNEVLFSFDPATPAAPAIAVPGSPVDPTTIVVYNGLAYLGGSGALYSFDGTTFTPVPALAPATNPFAFTVFDGVLYFVASEGGVLSLYSYSGGAATIVPNGETESSQFVEFDGSLYYLGFPAGLPVLTSLAGGVATAVPGSPGYAFHLTVFQGALYFTGFTPATGDQMFVLTVAQGSVPATPVLAATGFDPSPLALLAFALLGVGAAVGFRNAVASRPPKLQSE